MVQSFSACCREQPSWFTGRILGLKFIAVDDLPLIAIGAKLTADHFRRGLARWQLINYDRRYFGSSIRPQWELGFVINSRKKFQKLGRRHYPSGLIFH